MFQVKEYKSGYRDTRLLKEGRRGMIAKVG